MKAAFRNLPIHPRDWRWLVMMPHRPVTNEKLYFSNKNFPFGSSVSYCHFQWVCNGIEWLFKHRTSKRANNYLDNFFFVELLKAWVDRKVRDFLDICNLIKFSISLEKTCWGTQLIVFLGLLIPWPVQYQPLWRKGPKLWGYLDICQGWKRWQCWKYSNLQVC